MGLAAICIVGLIGLGSWWMCHCDREQNISIGWHQGFEDCARIKSKSDDVSDDEKLLLAIMKEAIKKQLADCELKKRGDIKMITEAASIKELEIVAWNIFIVRGEE